MQMKATSAIAAALLAATAIGGPVRAQTTGTTSGPAVGSPATLGTGGVTAATPHQTETIRNKGGVPITGEQQGQAGGTNQTVAPGASDAGSGVTKTR